MPGQNDEVIRVLQEIGDLLDLLGEQRFKVEAYRRAARTLESLGEPLARVAARNELDKIPGIGDALEAKIREFLSTGELAYLTKLRQQVPPGIGELMRLPGVGPKTARRFWVELGVEGPQELAAAVEAGRLHGVAGFGERKIEKLRQGLAARGAGTDGGSRRPLLDAWELGEALEKELRATGFVEQLVLAGSLRRRRETVGDLDLLATSKEPARVLANFTCLPGVLEVRSHGDTKSTVLHAPGIQVDLQVVDPASFGAALQYFTGSKDHNVHLRTIARDRGLKVNEYGVFRESERVAGTTEEEVYAALGLPFIPPEIRENHGEIEAAAAGTLPHLVEASQLRGDLHLHLPEEGEDASLEPWIAKAKSFGYTFLGVVLEEGPRLGERLARLQQEAKTATVHAAGVNILFGLERPMGATAAVPDGFEFLVLRPEGGKVPSKPTLPFLLGHLEAQEFGEERASALAQAVAGGWPIEVGPRPELSSLDSGALRGLAGKGAHFCASARPERSRELARIAVSLGLLRRGAVETGQLLAEWPPSPAPNAPRGGRRKA
jgi:DNA polymerase/3'-5' exonuclease PolX